MATTKFSRFSYTELINGGPLGYASAQEPVLLKESDIPEASLVGRKPAELGKANLLLIHQIDICSEDSIIHPSPFEQLGPDE